MSSPVWHVHNTRSHVWCNPLFSLCRNGTLLASSSSLVVHSSASLKSLDTNNNTTNNHKLLVFNSEWWATRKNRNKKRGGPYNVDTHIGRSCARIVGIWYIYIESAFVCVSVSPSVLLDIKAFINPTLKAI